MPPRIAAISARCSSLRCLEVIQTELVYYILVHVNAVDACRFSMVFTGVAQSIKCAAPSVLEYSGVFGTACWLRACNAERAILYEGFGSLDRWIPGPHPQLKTSRATLVSSVSGESSRLQSRWLRLAGGADSGKFNGVYITKQTSPPARPNWLSFAIKIADPEHSSACLAVDSDFGEWSFRNSAPCALLISYVGLNETGDLPSGCLAVSFAQARKLSFTDWRRRHRQAHAAPQSAFDLQMETESLGPMLPFREYRVSIRFRWSQEQHLDGVPDAKISVYVDGEARAKHLAVAAASGISSVALFNRRSQAQCYFSDICLSSCSVLNRSAAHGADMPPDVFCGKVSRAKEKSPTASPMHATSTRKEVNFALQEEPPAFPCKLHEQVARCNTEWQPQTPLRRHGAVPKSPRRGSRTRWRQQQWQQMFSGVAMAVLASLVFAGGHQKILQSVFGSQAKPNWRIGITGASSPAAPGIVLDDPAL